MFMDNIRYYKDLYVEEQEQDTILVRVPMGIETALAVFTLFFEKLRFPSYFGFNWDALYDCLTDLSWINEYTIIIVHDDIPFLNNEKERDVYVKLLLDVVVNWIGSNLHNLQIVFPEKYESLIENR
jgi:RNAse (barnase) inhibitor barstar